MSKGSQNIRKPAVAGLFYPASAVELSKTIADLYAKVEKAPLEERPLGLVVPHAGYPYSGRTAARAYKLLQGEEYETVVVISPSHTVFFKGAAVFDGDGYETPLGLIPTDKALSKRLGSIHPSVYLSKMGHASGSTRGEHALEVQLPFLQLVLGSFKLVAVVLGDQEEDSINALGEALASTLKGTDTLIVASTDLSHFHSEKSARRLDYNVQHAIEKFDAQLLMKTLDEGQGEACGGGVVAAVMKAARRLGGKRVQFLEYTTSGETTGDYQEVVGYMSAAIVSGEKALPHKAVIGETEARKKPIFELSDQEQARFVSIARAAIEAQLVGKEYTAPDIEKFEEFRGVFIRLFVDGEPRGMMGRVKARRPLPEAVAVEAVEAACEDPNAEPLTEDELKHAEIEISILEPLQRVHDFDEIKIGRDGLMVKLDMHSALILPQQATANNWDSAEFLQQTCLKAGLPKSIYLDKHAQVYKFTAIVFGRSTG